MITKETAVSLGYRDILHCTIRKGCAVHIGPRGGQTRTVTFARVNGKCQTWVTRPGDFRLPVKHGLYESGEVTQANAAHFHRPEDCPAGIGSF